ncbi:hypothetical protein D039_0778, partial [Vibrio parahaemolyticus EKP-028]
MAHQNAPNTSDWHT